MERKNMTNAEAVNVLGALGLILPDPPIEITEAIAMGMMALEKCEEITDLYGEMNKSLEKAFKELENLEREKDKSVWKNKNFFEDDLGGF